MRNIVSLTFCVSIAYYLFIYLFIYSHVNFRTLAPVRKASILESVGRRFSIFGNNKPAKVLNMDQHHQQQQIINNKPVLRKPASLQTPYE
jgi:hypothetical protein